MRDFQVTERVVVELRANMTNFLNHPQFMAYSGGLGGTTVVADADDQHQAWPTYGQFELRDTSRIPLTTRGRPSSS